MKVSVITVCLNSKDTIEQTILSVIGQTYKDIEYIIIDGGSNDGTKEIIERYVDYISIYISEPDAGIYDAMNKGIRMSTGEIIGIVNSDDWLEMDAVETVERLFEKRQTDIVYGNVYEIDKNARISVLKSKGTVDDDNIWKEMPIWHPAMFVNKDVYYTCGLYSTDYSISSDYEFVIRCYLEGKHFLYVNKVLSNFRNSGISSTKLLLCAKENQEIIEKYKSRIESYDKITSFYDEYIKCLFFEEKIKKTPIEMIKILSEMTSDSNEIILWGMGKMGHLCYEALKKAGKKISEIVDGAKSGEIYEEYKIKNPESLKSSELPILISIMKIKKEEALSVCPGGKIILLTEWIDEIMKKYPIQ